MLRSYLMLALPAIASNFLGMSIILINSLFAGRLGDPNYLAAVGLGNCCTMIFLITMYFGLNAAQDALTSQAFGNQNYQLCGEYLNRGMIINTVFFIPLAIVPALFTEQIFILVGQDKVVSQLA